MGAERGVARRFVLDTNVVVSELLFRAGALIWLRTAWQSGVLIPLVSRDTISELLRVLAYPKFTLTRDERENLMQDYLPWCEAVVVEKLPEDLPPCRDPADLPFLALARLAQADGVITGDRDLLAVTGFEIPIMPPLHFKELLQG